MVNSKLKIPTEYINLLILLNSTEWEKYYYILVTLSNTLPYISNTLTFYTNPLLPSYYGVGSITPWI